MAKAKEAVAEAEEKPVVAEEPVVEIVEAASAKADKIDGIDELKRQLEAEKEARKADRERAERAERERDTASQQAFQARNAQDDAEVRLFDGAVAQLKSNTQVLKQQLKDAWAANDLDRAADIQEAIADNAAKINSIEAGKQSLKERPKDPPRPLDPVEAFAQRLSPRSAAWVRAHPEYATDPRLNAKMIAAHQMAIADGMKADTDDYFEAVEDALKINKAQRLTAPVEDDEAMSVASAPTQRRQSPAAAPVSRDVTPSGERKRTIRLTKEEAEIARLTGQTEAEYYQNKMRDYN
jgi:chromosome segregation ATPase